MLVTESLQGNLMQYQTAEIQRLHDELAQSREEDRSSLQQAQVASARDVGVVWSEV